MIKEYSREIIKGYRLVGIIGAILFGVSLYKTTVTTYFLLSADVVRGEIVMSNDLNYGFWVRSSFIAHYPVVKFFDKYGREGMVTGTSNMYRSEIDDLAKIGVRVYYKSENLQDAKLGLFGDLWYWPSMLWVFSLLFLGGDYFYFLYETPIVSKNNKP